MTNSGFASLPPAELDAGARRAYVLALVTLANVDSEASPEELAFIHQVCQHFDCRLAPKDLVSLDLPTIAASVKPPAHRQALFADLLRMARRDRKWDGGELRVLKFLGEQWGMEPPSLTDVVWEQLVGVDDEGARQLSQQTSQAVVGRPEVVQAARAGFRWFWVWATVLLFVVACALAGAFASALGGDLLVGVARFEPVAVLLFLGAGFGSGLLIGLVSPGRTVLEPALGAALPLLAAFALVVVFVLPEQDGDGSGTLALSFGLAIVCSFAVTMAGAWLGERRGT